MGESRKEWQLFAEVATERERDRVTPAALGDDAKSGWRRSGERRVNEESDEGDGRGLVKGRRVTLAQPWREARSSRCAGLATQPDLLFMGGRLAQHP